MKSWFRIFLGAMLALASLVPAWSQSQPVVGVSMLLPGNESSAVYTNPVLITARGVGRGSYNYTFYVNGISIGFDNLVPEGTDGAITWRPPQPGSYFFHATVVDAGGNSATSLPIRFFATGTIINSPVSGSLVPDGSTVVLKADATTAQGFIKQIEFFDGATSIGVDTTAPYSLIYTPPGGPGSTRTITARAMDNNNNLLMTSPAITLNVVTPIDPRPTAAISSPLNNAAIAISTDPTAPTEIPVKIDANSTSGRIKKVEFYIDGALFGTLTSFPYTFTWTPTVVGRYVLVGLAYDDKENVIASSPINVILAAPPTVTIVAPTPGATVTGGSPTQIRANATDSGGNPITSVQFFVDGTFVGQTTTPVAGTTSTYQITATFTQKIDPDSGSVLPSAITALATNSVGINAVSNSTTVTVTSGGSGGGSTVIGIPPLVTVTSPAASTQVTVNAATDINAVASDPDGNITSVQFLVNNVVIGTTSVYPYKTSWTPAALGNYAITAKATDNDGNVVTSSAVSVSVIDPTPNAPSVAITAPAAGSTIPVNVDYTLRATATDTLGSIRGVQFFVNGQPQGALVTAFPYTTTWKPVSPGSYSISARAINASGIAATSTTVNVSVTGGTAPTVAITSPTVGTSLTLGSSTSLVANALPGPGATITSVQFYANGFAIGTPVSSFPYSTTFTPANPGTYAITAVATDSFGNQTTSLASSLIVGVGSNTAPVVTLTSPIHNTTFGVNDLTFVMANAVDPDGAITQVEFFVDGRSLGIKTAAPYYALWTPTITGTYAVTAVATDNVGNRTTSAVSTVTVAPISGSLPSAGLSFSDPHRDATSPTPDYLTPVKVTYGSKLLVSAGAVSTTAAISRVQFFANGTRIADVTAAPFYTPYQLNVLDDVVLTAIVTDSNGNSASTNPILIDTVSSTGAINAVAVLVSPVAGATVPAGSVITFSATHNFGNVTPPKIDFFLNGNAFTTKAEPPYTVNLGIVRPGVYDVHAVVRQGDTATASAPARITVVANNTPAVAITSPGPGGSYTVGNSLTVAANASDPDGTIQNVQFLVNGNALSTDDTSPYTAAFNPASTGSYTITALATDNAGNQTLSAPISLSFVSNRSPTVSIVSPANGTSATAGLPVTLTATAADPDGTIASVRYLANGNQVGSATAVPFTVSWTPTAAGSYSLVAQATDNSGNVGSSTAVTLTVSGNQMPNVALTSPTNGSVVRVGAGANLIATASDADGTVASVQFFANGVAVGAADTTPPYSTQWAPTAEGIYRITALATDNAGGTRTTDVVTVLVVAAVGGTDTVYSGNYQGIGETGRFTFISVRGRTGLFIGFSTSGTPRNYFFPGLTVDAVGGFEVVDGTGRVQLRGTASETGAAGTLDNGRLTFIGTVSFATGASSVPPGFYSGNLSGRAASTIYAIVGPDGSITLLAEDGSSREVGAGTLTAAGSFSVTTQAGNRFTGSINPTTGFLTGSLSGSSGGAITAALASGVSFSDGFLRNLSTRGQVGTGENLLSAGFVVGGTVPKRVLVRAIGPSLTGFGVTGALADTQLEIYRGSVRLSSNDNWGGDAAVSNAAAASGAFPLAPNSLDSAILIELPPGAYSANVSGVAGRTGIALVELYDTDNQTPFSPQKVMNVATRGLVGTGQGQLIAGFQVTGNTPKKVLIRGVGPALAAFGVTGTLADPVLRLERTEDGRTTLVRENDNWEVGNDANLVRDAGAGRAFALAAGSRDAAILISLPPGIYSAQLTGANSSSGVGMIEVYEVP